MKDLHSFLKFKLSMSTKTAPPLDLSFKDIPNLVQLFHESPSVPARGVQRALRLASNRIHNLKPLYSAASTLIKDPNDIQWIDLSFNQLTTVDEILLKYPNLVSLNLHANLIHSIQEFDKLAALTHLRHLTLHGNPIETAKPRAQVEDDGEDEITKLALRTAEKQCQR
jgi:Leucine-rich repeat (LRR) protein